MVKVVPWVVTVVSGAETVQLVYLDMVVVDMWTEVQVQELDSAVACPLVDP
jgi:hypothetical protein